MAMQDKTFDISQFMFANSSGSLFGTLSFYVLVAYLFLIVPTIFYFFRLPSKTLATSIIVAVLLFTSTLPLQVSLSHSLFVLVTGLKLFGPLALGVAVWAHVRKLQHLEKTLAALNIKIRNATFNAATLIFCVIQLEVFCCYAFGIFHFAALHSSAPIEGIAQALARLDHENWSVNLIGAGSVLQMVACFELAICTAFGLYRSRSTLRLSTRPLYHQLKAEKLEQKVLLAACTALPLLCVEPFYKVFLIYVGGAFSSESLTTFTDTEAGSLLAFTIDVLPPLALAMQNVWTFELQSQAQNESMTSNDNTLQIPVQQWQALLNNTDVKHEYLV